MRSEQSCQENLKPREKEHPDCLWNDFFDPEDEEMSKCAVRKDISRDSEQPTLNYFERETWAHEAPDKNFDEFLEKNLSAILSITCINCMNLLKRMRIIS